MKTGDDSRRKILERRAAFVAAALSSVCATGCQEKPLVCLAPVANEYRDAGAPPAVDAPTADGSLGTLPPEICLSVSAPADAEPEPCLKMAPPRPDAGPTPWHNPVPLGSGAAIRPKKTVKPCLSVVPDD